MNLSDVDQTYLWIMMAAPIGLAFAIAAYFFSRAVAYLLRVLLVG